MKKNVQQCMLGIVLLSLSCFSVTQAQTVQEIEVGSRTCTPNQQKVFRVETISEQILLDIQKENC